ncbi:hypothetical protein HK17_10285 [Acetobacter indonesiensis]|uniref:Uncharacterized protein n=1 Tax=Acetobacter indonesiensis TaxID=104101 RepID=A0A252AR71_9PROT|nr:hypothetical protein HK17_10285 [Acetobacter indonesiensis]
MGAAGWSTYGGQASSFQNEGPLAMRHVGVVAPGTVFDRAAFQAGLQGCDVAAFTKLMECCFCGG